MTMTHKEAMAVAFKVFVQHEDDPHISMEAAIRAYIEARGLVLVPREPTEGMVDEVTAADQSEPFSDMTMSDVYRAMLAAAPYPFGGE